MVCVHLLDKIVKNHKKALHIAFNGPTAEQYWSTKFHNLDTSLGTIDTQATESAMSKSTSARCRWASKDNLHMGKTWCAAANDHQPLALGVKGSI